MALPLTQACIVEHQHEWNRKKQPPVSNCQHHLSNSGTPHTVQNGVCCLTTHISIVDDTLSSNAHLKHTSHDLLFQGSVKTLGCTTGPYSQDPPSAPNTLLPSLPVSGRQPMLCTLGNLLLPRTRVSTQRNCLCLPNASACGCCFNAQGTSVGLCPTPCSSVAYAMICFIREPGWSAELIGLQTLYSGNDSEATHLSPGRQWLSAVQKHFIRELCTGRGWWVLGSQQRHVQRSAAGQVK